MEHKFYVYNTEKFGLVLVQATTKSLGIEAMKESGTGDKYQFMGEIQQIITHHGVMVIDAEAKVIAEEQQEDKENDGSKD